MKLQHWLTILWALTLAGPAPGAEKQKLSSLDDYIREALEREGIAGPTPGSLFAAASRYGDLARDIRASQVDDVVTIVVMDKASAIARGTTNSQRRSELNASVSALGGPLRAGGALSQLAAMGGDQKLQGQGETSRESVLTTTLSARVTHVLPNGNLVLEGTKDVMVNSERQIVTIRGVIRWNDLSPLNRVSSDRLTNLEVHVQGKGVVGDAIRRPNFLYRLLMGLLPF
jgi:flagellar L-ring protein precursor FlgH